MEQVIVTIEGCDIGPLKAERAVYEQEGFETLMFETEDVAGFSDRSVAELIYRNLNGANVLDVRVHNQPLGFYTLCYANHDRLVLVNAA